MTAIRAGMRASRRKTCTIITCTKDYANSVTNFTERVTFQAPQEVLVVQLTEVLSRPVSRYSGSLLGVCFSVARLVGRARR